VDDYGARDRDGDGLGHRDSNGFRDVNGNRHWIRDLHGDLHRIRYGFLDRVWNWLLHRHGVRLRNVDRVGPVHWNCYRDLYRDRDLPFNGHWIRLWHRDRDFLGDGDGLHVTPAIAQTVPGAQQAGTVTSERVATPVFQGISTPVAAQAVAVS
jgi:hypothetical protein